MEKIVGQKISVCWLRRDLRLFDNVALYEALKGPYPVLIFFIFDRNILDKLSNPKDRRVAFIHKQLEKINIQLQENDSTLKVFHTTPIQAFQELISTYEVHRVYLNHDYEPYAIARDQEIKSLVEDMGVEFKSYKDQVIYEKAEVLKPDETPYTVFTPYSKKWKERFFNETVPIFRSEDHLDNLLTLPKGDIPTLREIGFEQDDLLVLPPDLSADVLQNYQWKRDEPAVLGTSHLGIHLRFGTVSIRQVALRAAEFSEIFLNELIWREFFMMILFYFPYVERNNFRRKYDRLQWRNHEEEFELWCRGETGYPMVDAGMRQLNQTGWMHNRARMITAGFLSKHLLIDWRWGEAYFAEKLLDYELASNNGNWQWAAGTGCDSAPYFRIFNPSTQLKKYDPHLKYVKSWIKNFEPGYLAPIVDHTFARERALHAYKSALRV